MLCSPASDFVNFEQIWTTDTRTNHQEANALEFIDISVWERGDMYEAKVDMNLNLIYESNEQIKEYCPKNKHKTQRIVRLFQQLIRY